MARIKKKRAAKLAAELAADETWRRYTQARSVYELAKAAWDAFSRADEAVYDRWWMWHDSQHTAAENAIVAGIKAEGDRLGEELHEAYLTFQSETIAATLVLYPDDGPDMLADWAEKVHASIEKLNDELRAMGQARFVINLDHGPLH